MANFFTKKVIYLAGPEVFLPDSSKIFSEAKAICEKYGHIGICPFDGEPTNLEGMLRANWIYKHNCELIKKSDIVLANCNSFRGALIDDGTAFEIGYASALGKKIFGYIKKKANLIDLVFEKVKSTPHSSGYRIDEQGYLINEDFGNSINLMMEMAIIESGGQLIEGDLEDVIKII